MKVTAGSVLSFPDYSYLYGVTEVVIPLSGSDGLWYGAMERSFDPAFLWRVSSLTFLVAFTGVLSDNLYYQYGCVFVERVGSEFVRFHQVGGYGVAARGSSYVRCTRDTSIWLRRSTLFEVGLGIATPNISNITAFLYIDQYRR